MFPAIDTFLIGFSITAYVAAHAYIIVVLQAPRAREGFELPRRRG